MTLIDVWDITTFNEALLAELDAAREVLCNYEHTYSTRFGHLP